MTILQTVDKYVDLLCQIPPEEGGIVQRAEGLMTRYEAELRALGADDVGLELFLKFNYLSFLAEWKHTERQERIRGQDNTDDYLRVEYAARKFLELNLPMRKIYVNVNEFAPVPYHNELLNKAKQRSEYGTTLISGFEQMHSTAQKLSAVQHYKLQPDDVSLMVDYLVKFRPDLLPPNQDERMALFRSFCGFAYIYFRASTWSMRELKRKTDGVPPAETDWVSFVRRFSTCKFEPNATGDAGHFDHPEQGR